ncbi:MAG: hypothetical protein CMM87_05805 [Rickettsiales bacterium]|nr:hypothetical protein [Rickettsiales bacterium]|tara:strand:+ start:17752 stop:18684 length:933 start_codon:yes stop_codon:yes gene_type:complete
MSGKNISVKIRYIVCIAFLGSVALTAITLFSYEKFNRVFLSYRDFDDVRKTLYDFQSAAIRQDMLVASYREKPQNKLIHKVEEQNNILSKNLFVLENVLGQEFQESLTGLSGALKSSVEYCENLFISQADLLGMKSDLINIHDQLLQLLKYIDHQQPTTKIRNVLSSIIVTAGQKNLCESSFQHTMNIHLHELQNLIKSYPNQLPEAERKVLDQIIVVQKSFAEAVQGFVEKSNASRESSLDLDHEVQIKLKKAIDELHAKLLAEQNAIFQSWISNNALARHSMAFVALFTIVSLCWLMVGLSQIFSIRK